MRLPVLTLELAAAMTATVLLCLPHSTVAEDHHHAEFRCGKTFITFQAYALRQKNVTGALLKYLYTVRKAHIVDIRWVPPMGPPFVEMQQPRRPEPDYLVLNRVEDWSRLVECLD